MNNHKHYRSIVISAGIFLVLLLWGDLVFARSNAENFPTQKIYIPMFHSRPFFVKKSGPEASPIKKISVNEPGIAEVKIITPYELIIDGRYIGSTMCIIWYEDNSVDFLELRVTGPRPYPRYEVEVIKGIHSCPKDSVINWEW